MSIDLGTIDGLIGNLFLFVPGLIVLAGLWHLDQRGFFGRKDR